MADDPDPQARQKPLRIDGPTPYGGAYALVMLRPDGSDEIPECNEQGGYLLSTISTPPDPDHQADAGDDGSRGSPTLR